MSLSHAVAMTLALAGSCVAAAAAHPFKVELADRVPKMQALIAQTQLPAHPVLPDPNSTLGISVDTMQSLKAQWQTLDWDAEQARLNSFKQFTTTIEGLVVHFVHEKSAHPNAVPIVITHGWPGSFIEYLPVVQPLLQLAKGANGKNISFDVVLPSLPGFAFSSAPGTNWTIADTARVWHKLMVEVLGYTRGYAVAGSDIGGAVAWHMYDALPGAVRAAYINFFPFIPPTPEQAAAANQTLSPFEQAGLQRSADWTATGSAYFQEHTTKPSTLGLALQDNPIGQLAWSGEKYFAWSDPNGSLSNADILASVSLYYLSQCFLSSVYVYAQNPTGFMTTPVKANNSAPMGYGAFKFDVGHWPRYFAALLGNLTFYREHQRGGHFRGLDNHADYVRDVRDMMADFFSFA